MRRYKAFTLMELMVVIGIIILLVGLLLPALGGARKAAERVENNNKLKGIQNSMVLYADKNNGWYPGVSNGGEYVNHEYDVVTHTPVTAPTEPTASIVFWLLLKEAYFPPDELISPSEDARQEYALTTYTAANFTGSFEADENYSFAALDIDATDPTPGILRKSWRNNANGQIVVLADRNTETVATNPPTSIHNINRWEGSIAWNDGHVEFEQGLNAHFVPTRYDEDSPVPADNIFEDDGGSDAQMMQ